MTDLPAAVRKWDRAAPLVASNERNEAIRYGAYKRDVFGKATGTTLLVAVGTGADFKYFPADVRLIGIDVSSRMLDFARSRVRECPAPVAIARADVTKLGFADGCFDTVATSCTFCSVTGPGSPARAAASASSAAVIQPSSCSRSA